MRELACGLRMRGADAGCRARPSAERGCDDDDGGVFPGGVHVHGDCGVALDGTPDARCVSSCLALGASPTLISRATAAGRRFLVATTGIINGNTLIDAFAGASAPARA